MACRFIGARWPPRTVLVAYLAVRCLSQDIPGCPLDNGSEEGIEVGEETSLARTGSTELEVACQPARWRHAQELAAQVAGLLPASGERVVVAGCGTS
jgi:hypothetical protein